LTGSRDGMVPPAESFRVRSLVPAAELISLRGLGHLAHEEQPDKVATILQRMVPHEVAG
jgi:magnesium chelatase accessory protein